MPESARRTLTPSRALLPVGGPDPRSRVYARPEWCGATVLSQSEDQSRPHPTPVFVRSMSTQVRGLGSGTAGGAPRSDPQIATRTGAQGRRTVVGHPGHRMTCLGLRQETRAPVGRHDRPPGPARSHGEQVPFSRRTSTVLASNKYRSRGGRGVAGAGAAPVSEAGAPPSCVHDLPGRCRPNGARPARCRRRRRRPGGRHGGSGARPRGPGRSAARGCPGRRPQQAPGPRHGPSPGGRR